MVYKKMALFLNLIVGPMFCMAVFIEPLFSALIYCRYFTIKAKHNLHFNIMNNTWRQIQQKTVC